MFGQHIVLVDSNVLFSLTLRDWLALLYLEQPGMLFQVKWTEDILAEVIYRLRREYPEWDGGKIDDIRCKITETFSDGKVAQYEIDSTYGGTDRDDAHVHAAAAACGAHILLTADRGFKGPGLDPDELPYEIYQADEFFELIDDSDPRLVERATRRQLEYWADRKDLPQALVRADAPRFAERVRRHLQHMALRG